MKICRTIIGAVCAVLILLAFSFQGVEASEEIQAKHVEGCSIILAGNVEGNALVTYDGQAFRLVGDKAEALRILGYEHVRINGMLMEMILEDDAPLVKVKEYEELEVDEDV